MPIRYVLYNPYAGDGSGKMSAEAVRVACEEAMLFDITHVSSYKRFFGNMEPDADVVICGGDGTLNRFVNDTRGIQIKNKIYFFFIGTGNDFARDLGHERDDEPDYCINPYLERLPIVKINGAEHQFINGVGYGIDGYCCEVGDSIREQNERSEKQKPINYTAIAIKGLLFHFRPRKAVVTVDGRQYTYKKVWLAPTMNGRFYGGGMMPTPDQDRLAEDKKLSVMVFHGSGKLRTLMIFPSIFKGEHVKHTKHVTVLEGKHITVEFDAPTPLQIDGETILGVKKYEASA